VLVTGMPRSGTTWLARALAGAPGAGLPGREPMNPRPGQFALGGTLDGWTDLRHPTPQQVRVLRRCYRGLEPRTYSRYGLSSLGALLPWRTTIVKDPFALLSVPAIVALTGATPVVVYRHPGAVLASYRRMGWTANTDEMRRLQGQDRAAPPADDVDAMAEVWTFLHRGVLEWLPEVPGAILVSHGEVSRGGGVAIERLARLCGLDAPRTPTPAGEAPPREATPSVPGHRLHSFDREPEEVVSGWRARLSATEVERLEGVTTSAWDALESARTQLVGT
jgi:Sulfotransferase family